MQPLNLPPYDIKTRREGDKVQVFDVLRRRYVTLTPEEWVRQHFVHFLMDHLGYPQTVIANEVELRIGAKHLRCDSLCYTSDVRPRMIVEYKSPKVVLTRKVFEQISAYNLLLHVDYLVVSNGLQHACCKMDYVNNSFEFLDHIPTYGEVCATASQQNDEGCVKD